MNLHNGTGVILGDAAARNLRENARRWRAQARRERDAGNFQNADRLDKRANDAEADAVWYDDQR